ncbi:MAG TPA: hypothetical protein VGH04_10695 [Gemmatimonadaceae bacterium]
MGGSCGWFPLSRKEIDEWVEAHADDLPRTLAELSAYPVPFRRVIVNYVSPERRTEFWCEHLRTFIGADSRLSAEQCVFVEETIGRLPSMFGKPLTDARVDMKALEDRMRDLFTREQAGAMFGMVGPPEPPEGLPLPPGTRFS